MVVSGTCNPAVLNCANCDTHYRACFKEPYALRNTLLLGCDTFILLVSCINRLKVIVYSTNTLLQVWW